MEKSSKNLLLRCVSYGVILILTGLIFIGGYVYSVVDELERKISEKEINKHAFELGNSILEKDSTVLKEDLEGFLTFANQKAEIAQYLQAEKGVYRLLADIELPQIESNDCQNFRCIQIKKKFPQIPSSIWKGLLGTEDFRFLEHRGVDLWAIARAVVVDVIAMKFVQGGSTLTQQLMKNLFLSNERKLSRKFKEMIYAIYIENVMSKEQIVTLYLNEMFWGVHQGIKLKGFYAASLAYFRKTPEKLDDFEATILISLLKGPSFYNPAKGVKRITDRSKAVFKRLQGLNLVTKNDQFMWSDARWNIYQKEYLKNNSETNFFQYYMLSKNTDVFLEPFEKFVLFGSYLRNNENLKERTKGADVAFKVIIGEKKCESYDCEGVFSFYSKLEREKRKAITDESHQVGSLFKPIVYDTFIDLGRSYDEEISTSPITLNLKSGSWTPKDYSKAKVDKISLKEALQKSKNIPLVRVAAELGFDNLENILSERIPRLKTPLAEYPAQLLGALELSIEEVFTSYQKFLTNKCDEMLANDQEFEKSLLYYMSRASETTIANLVRPPLSHALVFGKTGTSNNGLDNWFFAFDGRQIYVFWYGVESERDKANLRLTGGSSSFRIFQDFINYRGKQVSEVYCHKNEV
ncbi:MAG: transglycosylase domain-containing protein [Bdellovibrionota bacterium]|nr:transglycosylase domain-containing protein [Bdellovibrionota bacterium]